MLISLGQNETTETSFLELAKNHYFNQDFHRSILYCTKAIHEDSTNTEAYIRRAMAKIELNDYFGAIRDYDIVLEYEPHSIPGHMGRGKCEYVLQDYERAILDFNAVIKKDPEHVDAYFLRAKAEQALDAHEESIQDFTQIIKMDPLNKDAYYLRGTIKISHGDISGGCEDLSRAGELGDQMAFIKIQTHCLQKLSKK